MHHFRKNQFKHEDLAISMYFLMMLMLMLIFFFGQKKKRKKIILQDFINKHTTYEKVYTVLLRFL